MLPGIVFRLVCQPTIFSSTLIQFCNCQPQIFASGDFQQFLADTRISFPDRQTNNYNFNSRLSPPPSSLIIMPILFIKQRVIIADDLVFQTRKTDWFRLKVNLLYRTEMHRRSKLNHTKLLRRRHTTLKKVRGEKRKLGDSTSSRDTSRILFAWIFLSLDSLFIHSGCAIFFDLRIYFLLVCRQ